MSRIRKHESIKSSNKKTWLVGPYIRLSKDDGNEESLSITNQKKIILEYLKREFDEPYEIIDWYIDDGISGTTGDERVEFQRAISDMKIGKINCIPCKTLSRAFRNYADQGYYLEQVFPTYNLRFISIGSPKVDTYLDPHAVVDGMELPINGLMNDRYAAKTSLDVRRTLDMKRRNGEYIGAFAPYGLKKDPENKNHLVIDDDVASVVRDIFHWRGNLGMGKNAIVKKLNKLGIPNPTAYKQSKGFNCHNSQRNTGLWSLITVNRILENEMYIGNMVQGKHKIISYKVHKQIAVDEEDWYVVEGTHDAVVDKELFEKVREMNTRDTRVAPGNKKLYLLSGFMRCADCNAGMRRKSTKRKKKDGTETIHTYYICSTRAINGTEFCKQNNMNEKLITEVVLKAIQLQINLVEDMANAIVEINKKVVADHNALKLTKQYKDKQDEHQKLINAIDSLYLDWKSGDITKSDYARMKVSFEEKAESIQVIITHLEKELKALEDGINDENNIYIESFLKYKNVKSLYRTLLMDLVDKIYISQGEKVTIKFRFEEQFKNTVELIENKLDNCMSNAIKGS